MYNKTCPFYESICSLDELDENWNHNKISKFWNFEGKGYKAKDSFFKPFDKKIMFNGFKICEVQVTCEGNNLAKKHVWLSIEIHFGIFCVSSYKPKYSYIIMYEFENSPPSHELF